VVSGKRIAVPLARGFPPIAGPGARVLILGSLPGRKSLEMSQYYAQPQNGFWRIMGELFGAGPVLRYEARQQRLIAAGVAVWDVLAAGERTGSLDSAIVTASIVINRFQKFFEQHPDIRMVCCNGTKASELYRRHVLPTLSPPFAALELRRLPSTSPANASIRFDSKLELWRGALAQVASQLHRDAKRSARS
jgi:double-stranded uracil-DNA glycosylase